MTFVGAEVRPGTPADVDVLKGYGVFITGGTLVEAPKNEKSRVCIELFNPEEPTLSIPAGVLCEQTGNFNCTMKSCFTQPFGIRLTGANIEGAHVHIFGSQLPYNSEVLENQHMDDMESFLSKNEVSDDEEDASEEDEEDASEDDEDEPPVKRGVANRKRKAETKDDEAEESAPNGDMPSKKKKRECHATAEEDVAEANKSSTGEKKDDAAKKKTDVKAKVGAKQNTEGDENASLKKKVDKKDAKSGVEEKTAVKTKADAKNAKSGTGKEGTNKKQGNDSDSSKATEKRTKTLKNGVKITEVMEGSGKWVTAGRHVAVQYKLRLENGKIVDKSTKKGFKFRLGVGECIPGFDAGVLGMREGGERHVVVPSHMGYGPKGAKPDVPPNATLLFDVKVTKAW